MQDADIPVKYTYKWATAASGTFIRTVPPTTGDPDAASQQYGFPSATFTPTASGGVAPDGRDFNGIFNQITAWQQWGQAGGPITYDATFQTTIGGYPKSAIIQSATVAGKFWMSTTENNITDPDASGAGWTAWTFGSGLTSAITLINTTGALQGGGAGPTVNLSILQASPSQLGVVKVDNNSIIIAGDGTISATTGGTGSVVSVGLALPNIFNITVSPITTAGTLTAVLANQAANLFFAGPTGGSSAPTFRSITSSDLPAATNSQRGAVQTDGTTTYMSGSVISANNLSGGTTGLTFTPAGTTTTLGGILTVPNGGTGVSTSTGSGNVVLNDTPTFVNKINVPAGSFGAPSIDFGGFGLYRIAANTLGFAITGVTPLFTLSPNGMDFNGPANFSAGLRLQSTPPATSSSTGVTGDIATDANFIYVCVATNTWKRSALSSW